MPDLALQSSTDLLTPKLVHASVTTTRVCVFILTVFILSPRQFCAQPGHAHGVFCRHLSEGRTEASWRVIEGSRRRMVVDVRLENKGENAYSARLNITYTPNLRFSSLNVKVGCLPCLKTNK